MQYDCIVIGGGIAGLQAAIQLGRYQHKTLVIDSGYGRSTLCRSYHNLLGWPDGVSGDELRRLGRLHASRMGVEFITDEVISAEKMDTGFVLKVKQQTDQQFIGRTLMLATGLMDRFPPLPGLVPCFGLSVYVCPDCDGYEVKNRRTIILGSGEVGANMALTLTAWTKDIVYINHEEKEISQSLMEQMKEKQIFYKSEPIVKVVAEQEGKISGVQLQQGEFIAGERGFIAFGGNEVKSSLAKQLGVERLENDHIVTNPRTKMTNISGIWAAGDVGVHSEQVAIAMGEGIQAAIWIHKSLMKSKEPIVQL